MQPSILKHDSKLSSLLQECSSSSTSASYIKHTQCRIDQKLLKIQERRTADFSLSSLLHTCQGNSSTSSSFPHLTLPIQCPTHRQSVAATCLVYMSLGRIVENVRSLPEDGADPVNVSASPGSAGCRMQSCADGQLINQHKFNNSRKYVKYLQKDVLNTCMHLTTNYMLHWLL